MRGESCLPNMVFTVSLAVDATFTGPLPHSFIFSWLHKFKNMHCNVHKRPLIGICYILKIRPAVMIGGWTTRAWVVTVTAARAANVSGKASLPECRVVRITCRETESAHFLLQHRMAKSANLSLVQPELSLSTFCNHETQRGGGGGSPEDPFPSWCSPKTTQSNLICFCSTPESRASLNVLQLCRNRAPRRQLTVWSPSLVGSLNEK